MGKKKKEEKGKEEKRFKEVAPEKKMAKSRKNCRKTKERSGNKTPYLKNATVITCAKIKDKTTKQSVRTCNKEEIFAVAMTEDPKTLMDKITTDDLDVSGSETDEAKRNKAIEKSDEIIDLMESRKAVRGAGESDNTARFLLDDEDRFLEEKEKTKKEKEADAKKGTKEKKSRDKVSMKGKRKKGIPMKFDDVLCEKNCAG